MVSKKDHSEEDVVIEDEDDANLAAKLKKVKEELAACKKERQEYLDGWQRLRADVANKKADAGKQNKTQAEAFLASAVADLLPTLDSFEAAMKGEAWETVDSSWRVGVEYIREQFEGTLVSWGVEKYGATGEMFDPHQYEIVGEVASVEEKSEGTIVSVERSGYRIGKKVIRPAQVKVAAAKN